MQTGHFSWTAARVTDLTSATAAQARFSPRSDGKLLVRVEVANEICNRAAGVRYHPVRRLHRHVVDVTHHNLASVAALNNLLTVRSGNDFSAQVHAPRPAREN